MPLKTRGIIVDPNRLAVSFNLEKHEVILSKGGTHLKKKMRDAGFWGLTWDFLSVVVPPSHSQHRG